MIKVQEKPFDVAAELEAIRKDRLMVGASVVFVGTVREMAGGKKLSAMTLEHYPGMTEKALGDLETKARARWPLDDVTIIHRYGRLEPGEDIVLVIATSAHRQAAFSACEFLMDWLKTRAPFWKLEDTGTDSRWVDATERDDLAAQKWSG